MFSIKGFVSIRVLVNINSPFVDEFEEGREEVLLRLGRTRRVVESSVLGTVEVDFSVDDPLPRGVAAVLF